ncbi:MAG: hypothetical protein ACR2FU_11400 [Streptosporangiaceae bacterium]
MEQFRILRRMVSGWDSCRGAASGHTEGHQEGAAAESGVAQFYEIDPRGIMTLRRTYEDWRTNWSLIHTGNFADHV